MRLTCVLPLACALAASSTVFAQPVLRSAAVTVVLTSPTTCSVTSRYSVDGPPAGGVEHRLHAPEGVDVEGLTVRGIPVDSSALERRGVTLAYFVDSDGPAAYELAYRVAGTEEWIYRCPIWLPVVPADGHSRAVHLRIELPPGAVPVGTSLPAFSWAGSHGETTIAHLPAFIRVPYATGDHVPGGTTGMDLSRIIDALAVVVLVAASVLWFWKSRRSTRVTVRERSTP